jgi:hypothetical protein
MRHRSGSTSKRVFERYQVYKISNLGRAEREILAPVNTHIYIFKCPPYMASRQLSTPRIAAIGSPSMAILQCSRAMLSTATWFTNTHRQSRGECRRAYDHNPLRGRRRGAAGGCQHEGNVSLSHLPCNDVCWQIMATGKVIFPASFRACNNIWRKISLDTKSEDL